MIAKVVHEHILVPNSPAILDEANITSGFLMKSKSFHH